MKEYQVYRPTSEAFKSANRRVFILDEDTPILDKIWHLRNEIDYDESKDNSALLQELFKSYKDAISTGEIVVAATVKANSLSDVFRLTNSIDHAWYEPVDDSVSNINLKAQLYSTSIGDLISDNEGKHYIVDASGMTEVE